jgi:hypothetical protein
MSLLVITRELWWTNQERIEIRWGFTINHLVDRPHMDTEQMIIILLVTCFLNPHNSLPCCRYLLWCARAVLSLICCYTFPAFVWSHCTHSWDTPCSKFDSLHCIAGASNVIDCHIFISLLTAHGVFLLRIIQLRELLFWFLVLLIKRNPSLKVSDDGTLWCVRLFLFWPYPSSEI